MKRFDIEVENGRAYLVGNPDGKYVSYSDAVEAIAAAEQAQHGEPVRIANPSPEQLYTMVTSRFESGSFPWEMVSKTGKAAWAAAAAELVFAPDTIMASHAPQPAQQQAEPVAWMYTDGKGSGYIALVTRRWRAQDVGAWVETPLYAQPPAVAVPDDLFQTAENAAACSHNFATAKQARSPNCIAQDRCKQMLELANEITSSASPEEDELLEVAYAIARYLKLDWPSAYDVDYAFKRIDEALTGMAITVEEEQAFEHLRAMLAAAEQPK